MKKNLLLLFLFLCLIPAKAQTGLSDEAQISILTAAPSDDEVYTVYGHTAIRVKDTLRKLDTVFNYGIFDFSKPNFIYRFTKGETDYKLAAYNFSHYIIEYQMRGSEVTEQVLNLTPEETHKIWNALITNVQPENAVYRYNFFFDNCATRPVAIVEEQVDGKVQYNNPPEPQTFRDLINYCTRNHPWLTFGCDLALGSPTDRIATPHEMMFLPLYLKDEFEKYADVYVATEDGSSGTKGNVLNAIQEKALEADVIFACGPTPMLRAIKQYAEERNIECYISLEERMACGIGACLGCVCKTKEVDAHSNVHNKRVCKDGPVFLSTEVDL